MSSDPHQPAEFLRDLYRRCAHAAFRRACELLDDEADAWDVVHEIFERLSRHERHEGVRERPMAYIYRATTNACLNVLKARRVRQQPVGQALVGGDQIPAMIARDLLEKLDAFLDDLDRQILVLLYQDGLSQREIAQTLDVWARTVGRRLHRLRRLVDELGAESKGGEKP